MKVAYCDISPLYLYTVHAAIICYVNRSLFRTDTWFVKYCRRVDLLQMNDSQHGNILCKSLFSLSLSLLLLDSIFQHWGLGCAAEEAWLCKVLSWLTWLSRDFYPVWSNAMQPQYFLVRGGHTHNVFARTTFFHGLRWSGDMTLHSTYIPCTTLSQASACTEAHSSWLHSKHEKTWVTGLCDQAASVPQDGTWWD